MGLCASFYWRAHGTAARQALLWHREPAGMRVCEFLLTEAPSASPRHHTPKTGSPAPTPAWRRCSALLPPRWSVLCCWRHLLRHSLSSSAV